MLEYLRNAADKPLAKVLMGILIFSFVGWGVAEWVFGLTSSDTTLLRVGGEKISIQQYNNVRSNELAAMSREEQRELYSNPVKMLDFQNGVIQHIASARRIDKHAHDLGYVVSDHRIANTIRAIPQFQDNGKFSPATFDMVLRGSGLTESDIAADIRVKALNTMVLTPTITPITTPQFVALATYNARNAKRDVNMTTVKFSDFKVGKPTDENLRDFYAKNPHHVPEARDISYVMIPAAMDKPDEYENGLKAAQKMEDDIIGGETLVAAAKKHGATFKQHNGISSEKLPNDKNINESVIAKIFELAPETESELIETKQGFVIVRVDKIIPEHNADFDSIKKELVNEWTHAEQEKLAYVRANELLVDLNKTGNLQNAKKLTVSRTDGAPMPVLVAAFKNPIGDKSIVAAPNAFYVLNVINEKLPELDTKKIEQIKPEITNMAMQHLNADYNSYLEREYPTKINEKMYNRFVK
ncbi:MAG: SurA N-terminal domain-containing protein [Alphaproteobacteria bacterium]|nr:SurA N-terminal domain-containing protein [Alphaproteobacteria bacterium]